MNHISLQFHVDAPIESVWELSASCERLAEWNVSFTEVRDCPGRLDRVGARYTAVARVLGRRIEGEWQTTRVEPMRLMEEQGSIPAGGQATIVAQFRPVAGGTDVSIEFDYVLPGGMFAGVLERLAGSAIERDLRHSNENFKELCEAAVATPT